MKIEIKCRFTAEVLFQCEADSLKIAVEMAVHAKADLRSADLRSANLSSANLRSADLRSADLRSANLSSANLRWANLRWANLRWANLRSADLRSADLSSANLRWANLRWANLRSANLRSADLSSADLAYFQFRRNIAYFTFDSKIRIGCHYETIKWWKKNGKRVGKENGYEPDEVLAYMNFVSLCEKLQKKNKGARK